MQEQEERLDTGGRAFGWLGIVASVALVAIWFSQLRHPLPVPVLTGAVFFGLLCWSVIVRPAVLASPEHLVLRNVVSTHRIPLGAVEDVALRQVLAVRAGDRTYVGTGVGRSLKDVTFGAKGGDPRSANRAGGTARVVNAGDFVEGRILELAGEARERAGVERYSDEQVVLGRDGIRRVVAWPVVGLMVAALVAFVLSCVL